MKTIKTKKPNMLWLMGNKKMFCTILAITNLLLGLNYSSKAQRSNTAYGDESFKLWFSSPASCGVQNSAFGFAALRDNTVGGANTAVGGESMIKNTTGSYNTAVGYWALYSNTTSLHNTAVGHAALIANTGEHNTAVGVNALHGNISGAYNTSVGLGALLSNKTGSYNTGLGYGVDVVSGNLTNATAIGYNAKVNASNTMQLGNNAVTKIYAGVGTAATVVAGGLQITGGAPAVGKVLTSIDASGSATWQDPASVSWSLTGNLGTVDGTNFIGTTDNIPFNIRVNNQKAGRIDANNAFYGYQSGNARTTGGYNTAMGFQSLYALTTGDGNIAIGDRSLLANTTGSYNTAVGVLSLSANTAQNNTAVGYSALINNKTGEDNTALGSGAGPGLLKGAFNNTTAIGYAAAVTASDQVRIGNTAVTSIGGVQDWTKVSDSRVKKDIQATVPGLAFITKLRPVIYHLNMDAMAKFLKTPDNLRSKAAKETELQTGFLAQEVEKAAQELNFEFSGVDKPKNQNDLYGLRYAEFTVPLVKAVQELEQKNQQLQQRLEALEKLLTGNTNITKDVATKKVGNANAEAEDISLYPNPTTGIFTITASNIDNGVIEIYDMAGNNLQKTTFNNAKSGYQLNVSGYAKGVYLLNIIANNKKYTKRLVIQ